MKEVRNGLSGELLSHLISCNYFEEAGHHHLPVGHTHEDVDAFFAVVTGLLNSATDSLQTPEDFKRLLEAKVGPMFAERGEFFHVVIFDAVPCN